MTVDRILNEIIPQQIVPYNGKKTFNFAQWLKSEGYFLIILGVGVP